MHPNLFIKRKKVFFPLLCFAFFFLSSLKEVSSIVWSGSYRAGGTFIENSKVIEEKNKKSYITHHFTLKPKIVVQDSVRIYGRFDFFNASSNPFYLNSVFGYNQGLDRNEDNLIRVFSQRSLGPTSPLFEVNHLYLVFMQDFGSFIVGRIPLNFGLGLTHNSGENFFDDWLDNRDVLAYKIVTDRFTLMPMVGKISEGEGLDISDDIQNILFHGQYESFNSNLILSVFYEWRRASKRGNDASRHYKIAESPLSPEEIFNALSTEDPFILNKFNFYISQKISQHSLKIESAFQWGETGVKFPFPSSSESGEQETSSKKIDISGFGLAFEYKWQPKIYPRWNVSFWGGMAQGDDSSTKQNYEFYAFDRNYDVAFLLFNHPLGSQDLLSTEGILRRGENSRTNTVNTESLSNAFYFSPRSRFRFFKSWSTELCFTAAWLWSSFSHLGETSNKKELGYEVDVNVLFEPNENLIWKTQIGLLVPGSAFKDCEGCGSSFSYGVSTKIGVRF